MSTLAQSASPVKRVAPARKHDLRVPNVRAHREFRFDRVAHCGVVAVHVDAHFCFRRHRGPHGPETGS